MLRIIILFSVLSVSILSFCQGCGEEKPCDGILEKGKRAPCEHSPILIDLDADGFQFSGPRGAVYFDLYGSGIPLHLQWVISNSDDAFLVNDLNGNGLVDDGAELFGNGTRLILEGELAPNGFVGLAQYDLSELGGNEDGFLSSLDLIWSDLLIWLDNDANGVSTPDEITTLDNYDITQLGIIPRESNNRDEYGNRLRFWSYASREFLEALDTVDVFFREVP